MAPAKKTEAKKDEGAVQKVGEDFLAELRKMGGSKDSSASFGSAELDDAAAHVRYAMFRASQHGA